MPKITTRKVKCRICTLIAAGKAKELENLVKKIAEGLDTEEEEKQTLAGVDDSLNSFKEARVRLRRIISNSIIKI